MKMNFNQLTLIILLSYIIILIILIFLFYKNRITSQPREGFISISRFYRPYYRIFKRGVSGYFNSFLNY